MPTFYQILKHKAALKKHRTQCASCVSLGLCACVCVSGCVCVCLCVCVCVFSPPTQVSMSHKQHAHTRPISHLISPTDPYASSLDIYLRARVSIGARRILAKTERAGGRETHNIDYFCVPPHLQSHALDFISKNNFTAYYSWKIPSASTKSLKMSTLIQNVSSRNNVVFSL